MFRRSHDVSSLPMLPKAVSQKQLKGILLNIIANVDVDIPIICNAIKCLCFGLLCEVCSSSTNKRSDRNRMFQSVC